MLHSVAAIVIHDNGKNIMKVSDVFDKSLVDVPHDLILHRELHELPFFVHSAVAALDLPEVPGEVGLVAAPAVPSDAEGVGPTEPRYRSGRRGRGGGEAKAAAGEELETGGEAPASGGSDGGHGGYRRSRSKFARYS